MRLKLRNKLYNIQFIHRIIPSTITQIIKDFYNRPNDEPRLLSNKLEGRVALVTGGYRGIGFAIANILYRNGAKVIITGRDERRLKIACDSFYSKEVTYMKWDVSDIDNCNNYFEEAISKYGQIHILVNNAGINVLGDNFQSFADMQDLYFHTINDVNVVGTRKLCTTFANEVNEGVILNIISNCAVRKPRDAYWISKWAIYSFTKVFGCECQKKGKKIVTLGLCPGPTMTDMMFSSDSSIFNPNIKNKRIGLPEEIAELAFNQIYTAVEYGYGNGSILTCDGGESLN